MKLLVREKNGLTVDEMARALSITRNAVRQHLAGLMNEGVVAAGATRPSGGRPERLYVLTERGRESFPRRYSWMAELLVDSIKTEAGPDGLRKRLAALGQTVARKLLGRHPELSSRRGKIEKISALMEELGYDTGGKPASGNTVEAFNCVFHDLALKNPDVCQFDLALLSTFTDSKVEHVECMARGGNSCRFKFVARS
jgi:predicted ArsR family transcriptional regulator